MILNNANEIMIGENESEFVYLGDQLIWSKVLVPLTDVHTSETSNTGTANESESINLDYKGWKAFDGILSGDKRYWLASMDKPQQLIYDFTQISKIYDFKYHTIIYGGTEIEQQPKTFTMEVSDDGVDWTIVSTHIDVPFIDTQRWSEVFRINTPKYGKYFRMNISESYDMSTNIAICELELVGLKKQEG